MYAAARSREALELALSELPETQRLALLLKVYENRSYTEIAGIMETSVASVESLLFRARENLKRIISREKPAG